MLLAVLLTLRIAHAAYFTQVPWMGFSGRLAFMKVHVWVMMIGTNFQFSMREPDHDPCYESTGRPVRCVPEFINAAFGKPVIATSTCGMNGPSRLLTLTLTLSEVELKTPSIQVLHSQGRDRWYLAGALWSLRWFETIPFSSGIPANWPELTGKYDLLGVGTIADWAQRFPDLVAGQEVWAHLHLHVLLLKNAGLYGSVQVSRPWEDVDSLSILFLELQLHVR